MNKEEFENIKFTYFQNGNYKIINNNPNNKICYIFCSSNGIYKAKMPFQYNAEFIVNNCFEWENISQSKKIRHNAGKFIFLRDLYQHSYVDGINKEIDSIDKIVEFLKMEIIGYDVYLVGNSGGGYLAMVLGFLLPNVKRIYSFGGLFSLYEWTGAHNQFTFNECEFYTKHLNDDKSKYFDIRNLIINVENIIYHFYGTGHSGDAKQISLLRENHKINLFPINEEVHGSSIYPFDMISVLSCSDKKLDKIVENIKFKRNVSKNRFSINSFGILHFIFGYSNKIYRSIKRRIFKKH